LLIVNYLPRKRKQILILASVVVLVFGVLWIYRFAVSAHHAILNADALQTLFGRLTFAQGPLVPSHWMARGLESAARGAWVGAASPLTLIWSNGLSLYLLAAWAPRRLYRRGYNRLATGGTLRRRYGGLWLDRVLSTIVGFLHPQTRLLIVKDFRT